MREALDAYEKVLRSKADTMKKKADAKALVELDNWYQHELPVVIQGRKTKFITHSELCKLMKWKLTRGKFRPRLTEMVQTNSPQIVLDASQSAFDLLPDVEQAIKALTVLKAVGPATASAILAAGAPDQVPFMADESMLAVLPGRPKAYTLPYFLDYRDAIKSLVNKLNREDSGASKDDKWTPHKVELALWAKSIASSLGISLGCSTMVGQARKRVNEERSSSVETDEPVVEGMKTKRRRKECK